MYTLRKNRNKIDLKGKIESNRKIESIWPKIESNRIDLVWEKSLVPTIDINNMEPNDKFTCTWQPQARNL